MFYGLIAKENGKLLDGVHAQMRKYSSFMPNRTGKRVYNTYCRAGIYR